MILEKDTTGYYIGYYRILQDTRAGYYRIIHDTREGYYRIL